MKVERHYIFLLCVLIGFFNPVTLFMFDTTLTFIVVVPVTLLVWFMLRWDEIAVIEEIGTPTEVLLGILLYSINIGRNALQSSDRPVFGLIDMFVAFVSICIIFYGLRGLTNFFLPTAYIAILIVGYELEFAITEVGLLQSFLATLVVSSFNLFGIPASLGWNEIEGRVVPTVTLPGCADPVGVNADCTGLKSMLAYGSLAILMLLDIKAPIRRKILWATLGLIGTFLVNIIRLLSIFWAIYFFGFEVGYSLHIYLGYFLFIAWVFIFWTIALRYLVNND